MLDPYPWLWIIETGTTATTEETTMTTYTQLIDIFTGLKMNKINVISFDSDTKCILISKITTAEIMAISATLKATGFNNEIIVIESLIFKIRFI